MCRLNTVGAEVAERRLVRAGTDITGFGLLGHLGSLCRASGVGAEIFANKLPIIANEVLDLIARDCIPGGSRENLKTANAFVQWNGATEAQKYLLTDAQTSGGLLLCVPPRKLAKVLETLDEHRTPFAHQFDAARPTSLSALFLRDRAEETLSIYIIGLLIHVPNEFGKLRA